MTISGFILKNAFRNKRRAALCVLSVASSISILVTLLVFLNEITNPPEDASSALRIAVRSKVSIATPLPTRQRAIIAKIPGVEAVTALSYFGGNYKGDENTFWAQLATEPEQLIHIFSEAKIPAEQYAAWKANRASCVVGIDTAKRYGLKIGDRLPIVGTIYPVDLALTIAGIYEGTTDDRNVFFHHKYLDELLGDPGTVGMWWIKARSADDVPRVIDAVNAAFANTSAEVLAETERAFQLSFISMWANISMLISSICTVVVFALLLVSASTMSMAIRERLRELSILKALGFRRHELFAFILAESFGLTAAGFVFGATGMWIFLEFIVPYTPLADLFPTLDLTTRILAIAAVVAAGLGITSSIIPSIAVARLSVVEGLRTLD